MRYGVNTWVWTSPLDDATLSELIPHVANMGFDWIELPIENQHEFDPARTKELLQEHELGVSLCAAMSPHRDLIAEDEVVRANGAQYVRHCIDTAQALGAQNVVGPLYSAVGRTWQMTAEERERDTELLVNTLRELSGYAHERGVILCVEPLNRFETSFINLVAQGVEVVDRVDHPSCQLMLDTFHMNIEERSLGEAIRLAGPRVRHVHTCENDRGAPGTGHVPWQEVADALRAINYDGPLVIESFTAKVKTIARAAAIWRPLAATQDDLARDGLTFLKQLF